MCNDFIHDTFSFGASHIQPIASESPCGKASTAGCDPAKASCPHHPKIDICYKVTKVSQSNGRSCWAASAASLLGTSSNICIDESAIAQLAGHWLTKLLTSQVDRILMSLGLVREGIHSELVRRVPFDSIRAGAGL